MGKIQCGNAISQARDTNAVQIRLFSRDLFSGAGKRAFPDSARRSRFFRSLPERNVRFCGPPPGQASEKKVIKLPPGCEMHEMTVINPSRFPHARSLLLLLCPSAIEDRFKGREREPSSSSAEPFQNAPVSGKKGTHKSFSHPGIKSREKSVLPRPPLLCMPSFSCTYHAVWLPCVRGKKKGEIANGPERIPPPPKNREEQKPTTKTHEDEWVFLDTTCACNKPAAPLFLPPRLFPESAEHEGGRASVKSEGKRFQYSTSSHTYLPPPPLPVQPRSKKKGASPSPLSPFPRRRGSFFLCCRVRLTRKDAWRKWDSG